MNVAVIVAVCVIGPVIVAALVNGNDAVAVIDAVSEHDAIRRGDRYRRHAALSEARRSSALERTMAMLAKLIDP